MENVQEKYFVVCYGTLREGGCNHKRFVLDAELIKKFQLKGYCMFRYEKSAMTAQDYPVVIKKTDMLLAEMEMVLSPGYTNVLSSKETTDDNKLRFLRKDGAGSTITCELYAVTAKQYDMICRVEREYLPVPIRVDIEVNHRKKYVNAVVFLKPIEYYIQSGNYLKHITHGNWLKYAKENKIDCLDK